MQKNDLKWWIDAQKLLDYIREKGKIIDAFYYVGKGIPPEGRQEKYLKVLVHIGYSLVTKDLKTIFMDDGKTTQKANLDVEIVLDMFNTIEHYDLAVLISGDGDFERPLQLLRARGKRFLVMSTPKFIAKELRDIAGMHFVNFEDIRKDVEKKQ